MCRPKINDAWQNEARSREQFLDVLLVRQIHFRIIARSRRNYLCSR